ncbi:zinc finger protein-like protein [Perilla frutescens var. hirtella]|nr:zinc finger protein-like protein [Perilla frutescens var. hirtella]
MWDREKTKKKEIGKGSGWFSFKNSLQCKSEASDVHDPRSRKQLSSILTKKSGRSGCSRSISNLRDVIHGSKRHLDKPPTCSPRSIGSSEFLNPITHEVILSDSKCELKITGFGGFHDDFGCGGGGTFVGTLRPGTPGPAGDNNATATATTVHYLKNSATPTRKNSHLSLEREKRERNGGNRGGAATTCHKCGEHFAKWEALESHHLSKHAVTELVEGDSSRKIVEIICRSSWSKAESRSSVRIERVLKVHNMQKTLARFEDYREIVKIKASKLPKKHPRCLADGNELLRFYGTFVACSLGINGSSSLCVSDICCVCRIIRHGFSTKREINHSAGGVGIFTTSTSGRAFQSIDDIINPIPIPIPIPNSMIRKALIVCRVIAGRVHRPLENAQEIVGQTGFDSLAGKVGLHSNVEELYLLSPKALLPCFVVICKTTT